MPDKYNYSGYMKIHRLAKIGKIQPTKRPKFIYVYIREPFVEVA